MKNKRLLLLIISVLLVSWGLLLYGTVYAASAPLYLSDCANPLSETTAQSLVNAANGREVHFDVTGNLTITNTFTFPSNSRWIGSPGFWFVAAAGLNSHVVAKGGASVSNVYMRGINIDGNKANQNPGATHDGAYFGGNFGLVGPDVTFTRGTVRNSSENIALHNTTGVEVTHNVFLDSKLENCGISLTGDNTRYNISHNIFDGNGTAVCFNGAGSTLPLSGVLGNNSLINSQRSGIKIQNGATGIRVQNNTITGNGYSGVSVWGDKNFFSNNTVDGNGRDGVHVYDGESNIFTGNHVGGNGFTSPGDFDGFHFRDNTNTCENNLVTNNIIEAGDNEQAGIGEYSLSEGNTFSNNIFVDIPANLQVFQY